MSASINFSALDQECKTFHQELFKEALVGMESAKVMTVMPGIKDKLVLTEMALGNVVQGWSKTFNPTANAITLTPRTLQVRMGKTDIQIFPEELRQSWLAHLMKAGVNMDDLPFERYILMSVGEKIQEELELQAIWLGDRSVGVPANAGELFDGFGKIITDEITATNLTETVTGAITGTNAVDKVEILWDAASPRLKRTKSRLYCSDEVYQMYCRDYRSSFGSVPYNNQFEKVYVEGSGNRCELTPIPSMGASQRMVLTPEWNMRIGADLLSDTNKVYYQRDVRALNFAADYAIGVQMVIVNDTAVVVNDQA